jgi:hypothetical protein
MKRILILCEGVTDQVFIADCLQLFYNITTDRTPMSIKLPDKKEENEKNKVEAIDGKFKNENFIGRVLPTGGCSQLLQVLQRSGKENIDEGGQNIVIFDADFPTTSDKKGNGNKGFENATKSLTFARDEVSLEYYLWPDNQNNGDIETLLRQLIPENKEAVMDCIEQHQECLKKTGISNLRYAGRKDLLGFYLYTNSIAKTRGRDVDYTNLEFWNLDPDQNQDLKKFKNFLDKYFL